MSTRGQFFELELGINFNPLLRIEDWGGVSWVSDRLIVCWSKGPLKYLDNFLEWGRWSRVGAEGGRGVIGGER